MAQSMVQAMPQVSRRLRNPQMPFNIRHAPFQIQPFMIAPVLPGETMKNLSLQSRVLTQPITNPLIGWWIEFCFFYVKHRDMHDPEVLTALMLDASADLTTHEDYVASSTPDYFYGFSGVGMNWVKACTRVVVENYFRDEGRAWDSCTIDGYPACYLDGKDWTDSLLLTTEYTAATDVTIPVNATPDPDVVLFSDVQAAMRQYELLRMGGLVNATYEDWLRSYGVRSQSAVVNKPELIRYIREWSYPSSHVQPNATTPALSDVTSAVSWSIAERADKDRFFKEPGFVIGFTVARPKMYKKQAGTATVLLDDAFMWLPAILGEDKEMSWRSVTDAAGHPLSTGPTADMFVDMKDLFLYGEQFRNYAISTTGLMRTGRLPA